MREHGYGSPTLVVAAGKGGTGKTLLSTSLALVLEQAYPGRVQFLDLDVEEPNAHLLLHPTLTQEVPVNVVVPAVDLETCTRCGRCAAVCQNSAIAVIREAVLVLPALCSGCGACGYACPVDAISEVPRVVGTVSSGHTPEGLEFHTGCLNVGEAKATPVSHAVKAHLRADCVSVIDAPPGTACPMQEAVHDADYCLLVTEPTPFGRSDLQAAVETCRTVGTPCGVVINRHGSGYTGVETYCASEGLPLLGVIPQERGIAEAYSRGEAILGREPRWQRLLLEILAAVFRTMNNSRGE